MSVSCSWISKKLMAESNSTARASSPSGERTSRLRPGLEKPGALKKQPKNNAINIRIISIPIVKKSVTECFQQFFPDGLKNGNIRLITIKIKYHLINQLGCPCRILFFQHG